jgi:hypothetical protein
MCVSDLDQIGAIVMKKAFLLVLLTAAPALGGGWPWWRSDKHAFQSEYAGFVDHWPPVVEARAVWQSSDAESQALIEQQRMALTYASPTVVGPKVPATAAPAARAAAPLPPPIPVTPANPPTTTRPK